MISPVEWAIAEERGRLIAAAKIAEDPEARKRVEDAYGVEYCRNRYPEAYQTHLVVDWARKSLKVLAKLAFYE
jgi:hypothetical protein